MRTTLIISDPVYRRATRLAKEEGRRLSALVTEATEEFLLRTEARMRARKQSNVRLKPFSMGVPTADLDNREELYRKMEEA